MDTLSDLLVANIPKYKITIPSTKKKTLFRPFLVKEEKILLLAQSTGTDSDILNAIKHLIEVCVDGVKDASTIPLFDVEYLFINLRAKSVSEKVKPKIKCPFSDEEVELSVNLEEVQIKNKPKDTVVSIDEFIKIKLRYPTLGMLIEQNEGINYNDPNMIYELVVNCIEEIITKEESIDATQLDKSEISSFVDNMTKNQFEKLIDFFLSLPKIEHRVPYTTSDGKTREVVLSGLSDFFG